MKTPLAYFGGKQILAPQIVAAMPPHEFYLEAFVGGAAVLFAKPLAAREVVNDLNGQVAQFWEQIRHNHYRLADAIAATPYSRQEWERSLEGTDDPLEGARRFLVRFQQSFGKMGNSWSPPAIVGSRWQPHTWVNLPPLILAAAERMREVAVENMDALDLIPRYDKPGVLIYCDPPYAPSTRRAERVYDDDVDEQFWPQLREVLSGMDNAQVMLSGYPTGDLEGWTELPLTARRLSTPQGPRELTTETLWLSPNCPDPRQTLFPREAHV